MPSAGNSSSSKMALVLSLLMVSLPLVAAAPVMAETGGMINAAFGDDLVNEKIVATAEMPIGFDPDVDYHGVCSSVSNWVINSNVVCTSSDFTVTNYVTISSSGSLTLEQNSVMRMNVPYYYYYQYKVDVQGTLKVMNSTIRSSSTTKFYGVYANGGTLRYEGATIQDTYYYGAYVYGAKKVMINNTNFLAGTYYQIYVGMTSGYITNSTFTNALYYGIYANNIANMDISNNTFTQCQYGVYFYSYNGNFFDNTLTRATYYGAYMYNSNPYFEGNYIHQNSQAGLYLYMGTPTIKNCTVVNNGNRDFWLEAGGGTMTVRVVNTKFNKVALDVNAWGGGKSEIEVYWYANASVKWLSDGSPAVGAEVTIEDQTGAFYPTDLYTNSDGEVNWLELMEYSELKTGKIDRSPHWVNATGELEGREIMNFTQLTVKKDTVNNAEVFLDDVPPPIAVTSPGDGYVFNTSEITVEGQTEPFDPMRPAMVQLRLGGSRWEPTIGADGRFTQTIPITTDGTHLIEVSAFDWVLNENETSFSVLRDTVRPPLEILGPVNELLTNITKVTVEGTTEVGGELTVTTNKGTAVPVEVDDEGKWSTVVDLKEGENTITVKVVDIAENWMEMSRTVNLDTKAPPLIVSDPYDGLNTNDRNLRVAGLTEQFAIVTLNGQPVMVAGAGFQTTYQLAEGENTIILDACDMAGNHNTTKRTVFLDTIPPTLELYKPAVNNLLVNTETITIEGYVDPGAAVNINNREVDLEGDFTYEVELKEGKNKITVEAVDDVGNRIQVARSLIRDTTPPMLAVFSPEDGLTYSEPTVIVEGSVEPNANLTINGKAVATVGGVFSLMMDLAEGENTITIRAEDKAGNTKTEELTVFLDTIVNLDVDTSMFEKVVKKSNITITGSTDPGARVFVNGEQAKVRADGKFTYGVNVLDGNNSFVVQAYDEYNNQETLEFHVNVKVPGGSTETIGGDIGSKNNWWLWIVILVLMFVAIGAVVGHHTMTKRKARDREIQAQADEQAAAIRKEDPSAIYDSLYGPKEMPADQYTPSPSAMLAPGAGAAEADDGGGGAVPTATATAARAPISQMSQDLLDKAEHRMAEVEEAGGDTTDAKRNLRLAKQFAMRGNSEKCEYYAHKVIDILEDQ